MTESHKRRLRISRDGVIFLVGIAGIIFETVAKDGDQPTLLILFGAMIGLPAFLHGDETLKKKEPPVVGPPPEKVETPPSESP